MPDNAGDAGLNLGLGRSPGKRNGNPPQYSCLGNPTDRWTWWSAAQGVAESRTWLSLWTITTTSPYSECLRLIIGTIGSLLVLNCFAQSCVTLFGSMDCNPPGSSVHGIFKARILEGVVISYSRGSFWPRNWTHISCVSCIDRWIPYH